MAPRANFDGPQFLLRIGIEIPDREHVDYSIADICTMGSSKGGKIQAMSSLRARVRLRWDEIQLQDLSVSSHAYASSGEAIGCLARWRAASTSRRRS